MKQEKSGKFIHRLRSKYRLSLLQESTYEERFSILLTPLNIILLVAFTFVLVGGITYALVAFTPLKAFAIPGYVDDSYREDALAARQKADSAMVKLEQYEKYLGLLSGVLKGDVSIDSLDVTQPAAIDDAAMQFELSEPDSTLRSIVEEEDRFALNLAERASASDGSRKFLFKPLEGTVSSEFDPDENHFGIDMVAPESSVVKSVLDGTVIISSYTSDGGHVIQVQHNQNLISVYKHNSVLLKKTGDRVKAGESIAVIGNTGDHSDGPHLHFELWDGGVPVNPRNYLNLEE